MENLSQIKEALKEIETLTEQIKATLNDGALANDLKVKVVDANLRSIRVTAEWVNEKAQEVLTKKVA